MVRNSVFCVFEGYFGKKQPQKCCFRGQNVVKSVANVDSKLHLFRGGKICNIFRYFFGGTEGPPGELLVSPPMLPTACFAGPGLRSCPLPWKSCRPAAPLR